jgi:hypothetical protein
MRIELPDSARVIVILPQAPKRPNAKRPNVLGKFILNRYVVRPNAKALFADFRREFDRWLLGCGVRDLWSMRRVREELIARGYPIRPGAHNNRYVVGLAPREVSC